MSEEERRCRLRGKGKEEIEHVREECVHMREKIRRSMDVLNGDEGTNEWK